MFDGAAKSEASKLPAATDNDLVLQHLNARGFVPFHPTLAHNLGHKAALFLGLCLYWTRHSARNTPQRHGWIHLSAAEIATATTLTRREQDTVRAVLGTRGLVEEQLRGRPAKMHYRLNLRLLANRLEIIDVGTATVDTAWAWFEKSVSFYRPLGDLAGSAAGGLYLSFALRQQRKALLAGGFAGLVPLLPEEIERVLCLSPKVQRTVRERLKRLGLLTNSTESAHLVRINIQAILACVRGQDIATLPKAGQIDGQVPESPARRVQASRAPFTAPKFTDLIPQPDLLMSVGKDTESHTGKAFGSVGLMRAVVFEPGFPGQQVADFQQLGRAASSAGAGEEEGFSPLVAHAESDKLDPTPSGQTAKLERSESAQSAKLEVPKPPNYIQSVFTNTTTTNKRAKPVAGDASEAFCRRRQIDVSESETGVSNALNDLIFPTRLPATVLAGVRDALLQAPAKLRQQLLDELQGQLQIPTKTIRNPVGYLLGLIRGCRNGTVLALAETVALDRERRTAVQQQRQAAMSPAEDSPIASPQVREEARARLQALRQEYVSKGARS